MEWLKMREMSYLSDACCGGEALMGWWRAERVMIRGSEDRRSTDHVRFGAENAVNGAFFGVNNGSGGGMVVLECGLEVIDSWFYAIEHYAVSQNRPV